MTRFLSDLRTHSGPHPLPSLEFPHPLRLLVLAPHPDDFDAIGVTLRFFHERGHSIMAAIALTRSGVEDSYCNPPTPEVKEQLREREQRQSIGFFGLASESLTFLNLERAPADDDQPIDNPANRIQLTHVLRNARPDLVFLPHGHDSNSGHRHIYSMLKGIAAQSGFSGIAFLNRDAKTIAMRPDVYMPFGPELAAWKGQLLRFHGSQQQRNLNTRHQGFDDRVLNVNRQIAKELAMPAPFAEAFELEWFPCG